MTRYFVDQSGKYLGGYDGPDEDLPAKFKGATEVPAAPEHARQVWSGGAWGPLPEAADPGIAEVTLQALKDEGVLTNGKFDAAREKLKQQRRA